MSGPWEDYGGAPTPPAQPAPKGPVNAPMVKTGPWQEYGAPAAAPDAAPDGDGMHTYQTMHGKDVVQFKAPADASDADIRQLAAQATGSNVYLRSNVQRGNTVSKAPPPPAPETSAGGAVWDGIKHMALMGGADEIQGVGGGIGSLLGGRGFQSGYEAERDAARAHDAASYDQHGGAYALGNALGILPTLVLPGGAAARVEGTAARGAALAGVGAGYGAVGGALGADDGDRGFGGMTGAITGAVGGTVLPGVLNAGASVTRRLLPGVARAGDNFLSRLGDFVAGRTPAPPAATTPAESRALDALVTRAPQQPGDMAAAVAERRAVGVDPTLTNVLDEQGAGTLRAAGQRGEARNTAVRYAKDNRADLQDQVSTQAAPISPESRPTDQVVSGIEARRGAMANEQYDAIRDTPVPVTDDLRKVLDTGAGRKALSNAINTSDSPDEVAGFLQGLKRSNEPSEMDRMMSLLPEGMNPAAKAQVRAQLESQGIKGSPPMPDFTLDMLDRVKRSLQAAQRQPDASGLSRQYQKMVSTLIEHGDAAAPGYATARGNFAEQSGLADAAETGAGVLRGNPDEFATAARGLSRTGTMQPASGVGPAGPSEQYVGATAARRAIENQAGDGSRSALAVADRLAYGRNALNRLSALTDTDTAARVQRGMRVVADDARRTNFLDPNAGSKTASLSNDMGHDAAMGALSLASGHHLGFVHRVVRSVVNKGISEADANQLWHLATDPSRTSAAVDYLTQRGASIAAARQTVRSIAARAAGELAGGFAGTQGSN